MTHALINVKNVHIHLPRPKAVGMPSGIPLAAFAAAFAPAKQTAAKAPAIGQPWPGVDGVYVGVARGEDGAPDAHLVLLNAKPAAALPQEDGAEWASAQMEGARMPTRFESALIYANARDHVDTSKWHWTSTLYGDSYAWVQSFDDGTQYDDHLSAERAVRAVCRFPL